MSLIFETEHLCIRQSTMNDVQGYLSFWNDSEVMKYIGDGTWGGGEDVVKKVLEKNISQYETRAGLGEWAVEKKGNNKVIGEASLGVLASTGDIEAGYILCKEYWGRGLGTELLRGLLQYAFSKLKLEHIVAVTNPENLASIRVMEKCGMAFSNRVFDFNIWVNRYTISYQSWLQSNQLSHQP